MRSSPDLRIQSTHKLLRPRSGVAHANTKIKRKEAYQSVQSMASREVKRCKSRSRDLANLDGTSGETTPERAASQAKSLGGRLARKFNASIDKSIEDESHVNVPSYMKPTESVARREHLQQAYIGQIRASILSSESKPRAGQCRETYMQLQGQDH